MVLPCYVGACFEDDGRTMVRPYIDIQDFISYCFVE